MNERTFEIELDGHPTEQIVASNREKAWDEYKRRHLRPLVDGIMTPIRPANPPVIREVAAGQS